jgi:hypothetical protein
VERLTDTQREILSALCRPYLGEDRFARPASNSDIAAEVFLSVDAVKAHLRALYKAYGIESLPHNEKRARLVELVLESDALDRDGAPPTGPVPEPSGWVRRRAALVLITATGTAAIGGLAVSGAFSGSSGLPAPSKEEFTRSVDRYCRMALAGQPRPGPGRRTVALSHLAVIETMRGRLESLTPPRDPDRGLDRFRTGLERAADLTSRVAGSPPVAGSARSAQLVAELTLAAGKVQAGAVGYGLSSSCSAIGDVVARSAQNAAGPP